MKKVWSDKAWDDTSIGKPKIKKRSKELTNFGEFIDILSCKGHYENVKKNPQP